jgi:SAM-dependent methyltransferase
MPALACPECHGALESTDTGALCRTCAAVYPRVDGLISFRGAVPVDVEDDYFWDFRKDPRITPMTVARWRVLTGLLDRVPIGRTVVAVGAGGEHPPARQLDGRVDEYVVVDTSARQLVHQRFPDGARGTVLLAAGERLPLADASADTVELWSVLDHFVDPWAAIREARRVLRPGGNIVLALGNDGSWYRRMARRLDPGDSHAHLHRFDVASVTQILGTAFETVAVRTVGYLRLPLRVERAVGSRIGPRAQDRLVELSDALLRRVFGPRAGGMMFVVGRAASVAGSRHHGAPVGAAAASVRGTPLLRRRG